ncbi:MAG: hypothetical protein ACPL7K_08100, partial [Armatimonadota bacterium]
ERELASTLTRKGIRCRTGLLLVGRHRLGYEPHIAAKLGMQPLDFTGFLASSLPTSEKYVDITFSSIWNHLDLLANRPEGDDCLLVYNFDLPLAKLETKDRLLLWQNLKDNMPYRQRALVLLMPAEAEHLLPSQEDMLEWERTQRLVRMP